MLAGEHGAALGVGLVAHGNHIVKMLAAVNIVLRLFGEVTVHAHARFLHRPDHVRIKLPRFDTGA